MIDFLFSSGGEKREVISFVAFGYALVKDGFPVKFPKIDPRVSSTFALAESAAEFTLRNVLRVSLIIVSRFFCFIVLCSLMSSSLRLKCVERTP